MAAPVAVPVPRSSRSIPSVTAWWSTVGEVMTWALRLKDSNPSRTWGGRSLTKVLAEAVAASSREGDTSVASIEADTSMTSMIVAASFGTRTWWTGWAIDTIRAARARATAAAGTWRRHPGRAGATSASRATLVKRTAAWRRRRWTQT